MNDVYNDLKVLLFFFIIGFCYYILLKNLCVLVKLVVMIFDEFIKKLIDYLSFCLLEIVE